MIKIIIRFCSKYEEQPIVSEVLQVKHFLGKI